VDKGSFSGVAVAAAGILIGLTLEGGSVSQILQPTAALIVFGGTLGAVLLQFPLATVIEAFRSVGHVFFGHESDHRQLVAQLVGYANQARREGVVSLDAELASITDPFLQRSLMLAVDGTEPQELRHMMELELDRRAEHDDQVPAVLESAGGFSPTIGIIGAVLGLIQVMQHLQNMEEVGRGIAVAFVATIYGVGAANLFFLPAAGKVRLRFRQQQLVREMTLEGVASILEGINPRMLETKLFGFVVENQHADAAAKAAMQAEQS
jgi:chemotaxis protein MotA